MSQFDWGTIDPYVVDGVELADFLNQWRDAILSLHRGATRPPYVVPGMLWISDAAGPSAWVLQWYVSPTVGDVSLFTLNTTSGAITISAAAGGALAAATLLAQAAASPSVQWNATGNPIDQKNWRMTVSPANGALRLSSYSDAGVETAWVQFNRDGSTTGSAVVKPSLVLWSEQVLSAPGNQLVVSFPVNARLVQLNWDCPVSTSADGSLVLGGMVGATPQITANYHQTIFSASGANTYNSAALLNQTQWALTSVLLSRGTMIFTTPAKGGATGHWGGVTNSGTRVVFNGFLESNFTALDGFRLYTNLNWIAGSFLRCLVLP